MTRLVGAPPTDPQDAATKAYVDAAVTSGATSPLTGATDLAAGGVITFDDGTQFGVGGKGEIKGGDSNLGEFGARVTAMGGSSQFGNGRVQIFTDNSSGTSDQVLVAVGDGDARWMDPPAATFLSVAKWA